VDFEFSDAEREFVAEVERFIQANRDDEVMDVTRENMSQLVDTPKRRAFMKKIGEQGWLGMTWPKEYGGKEVSGIYEYLLNEHLAAVGAPQIGKGVGIVGKTIMRHGSETLKREFLPKILNNEVEFAIGYSEPQAGSDAAAMALKATRDGDGWRLNGQKIFTTSAHFAQWYWVGARTDPDAPKHKGISLFLVPMNSPGITVTPMPTIGDEITNMVFLDDVYVGNDYMVGERGRGFNYISEALDLERFTMFTFSPIEKRVELLVEHVKTEECDGRPLREDPLVRHTIAQLVTQTEVARCRPPLRRRVDEGRRRADRRGVGVQALRDRAVAAGGERVDGRDRSGRAAAAAHRGRTDGRPRRVDVPLHGHRHDRRRRVGDPEEHHRAPEARAAQELLTAGRWRTATDSSTA